MDKLSDGSPLRATTGIAIGDGAGFLRHLARAYPDGFDRAAGRMVMGLASAEFHLERGRVSVTVTSSDAGDLGILKGLIAYQAQNWPGTDRASVVWTGDGAGSPVLPHLRPMVLAGREWVAPRLCRIWLEGSDLTRFSRGGWHVRLLLPPQGRAPIWPHAGPGALPVWPEGPDRLDLRTYTLRHVQPEKGRVAIDVVMHEPAGRMMRWAATSEFGAPIGMMGPGGGEVPPADWVILAGDETALPAIARALETLPAATQGHALIEVEDEADEIALPGPAGIGVRWLHRRGVPAGLCTRLCEAVAALNGPPAGASVFAFSGTEFTAYTALRAEFRKRRGLKRQQHLAMAYWRRGQMEGGA